MDSLKKFVFPAFWALFGLIVLKSFLIAMFDPDLWWHLAAGREMIENHIFLRTDIFSHTLQGQPWVNFEWLFQIVLYLLYKAGGLGLIYISKIVVCLVVVAAMLWMLRQAGLRGAWLLALSWLGYFVLRPRLFERAELATLLLLGLWTGLVIWARKRPDRLPRFLPWVFFSSMLVWVNTHGGFVMGVGLLALLAVGARWAREPRPFVRFLEHCFTLSLLATMINPHGPYLITVHLQHAMDHTGALRFVQEWAASTVASAPFYWLMFTGMIAGLIRLALQKKTELFFWAPVLLVFGVFSASSIRSSAILVFPALAFLSEVILNEPSRWRKEALGWILAAGFLALAWPRWSEWFPRVWFTQNGNPSRAIDFLERERVSGTVYNSYEFGGALAWRRGPAEKVFMDGRYIFLPLAAEELTLNGAADAGNPPRLWQLYFDQMGVDYAIVGNSRHRGKVNLSVGSANPYPLSIKFPAPRWALVYWDDNALVFVKRTSKFAELIKAREFRVLRPYNLGEMQILMQGGLIQLDEFEKELQRQREDVGPTRIGGELEFMLDEIRATLS